MSAPSARSSPSARRRPSPPPSSPPRPPAFASSQTVTVNFASTTGTANGVGSGFLYGLSQDGTGPDDGLLASLAPTSGRGGGARLSGGGWIGDGYTDGAGFTARIDSAIGQAKRLNQLPTHAPYDLLVSDLYGADTTQPSNTVYPCANGNCSNWISFIDDVVADVQAAGVTVNYDIWNEPDNGSFWATRVRGNAVLPDVGLRRQRDPQARPVGEHRRPERVELQQQLHHRVPHRTPRPPAPCRRTSTGTSAAPRSPTRPPSTATWPPTASPA